MKYLILLLVIGCAHGNVPDVNTLYKKKLHVKIDGKNYIGTASVANKAQYKIEIKSKGTISKIVTRSCNRNYADTPELKSRKWWFDNKKIALVTYIPNDIERGVCGLHIEVFEKNKARHGYFFMVPDAVDAKLSAKLSCDGKVITYSSNAICDAKVGLLQKIDFKNDTACAAYDEKCELDVFKKSSKSFKFKMIKDMCLYKCRDKVTKEILRLYTFGFEGIL